jgi:hypothetical protein
MSRRALVTLEMAPLRKPSWAPSNAVIPIAATTTQIDAG